MQFTMRMLVVMALCLCFAVPSPVLSFTLPEDKFAENQMTELGEETTDQKDFNSIAKSLIRTVLDAAEGGDMVDEKGAEEEGDMILAKRGVGANRPGPERRRAQVQSRPTHFTSRGKFTFGKRSPSQLSRSNVQQLLEELEKADADQSLRNKLALLDDAALYDTLQDNHQVQKDAYSAFSFGKRGISAFSFGKRGMPSFAFGKRGMPSFAFGKRRSLVGSAFPFGRRDWVPTEQDLQRSEEMGPYEIKRNLAFAFGKRDDQ